MSVKDLHPFRGKKYTALAESFDLSGRVYLLTGGGGYLGVRHAEAIMEANGTPVINDIHDDRIDRTLCHLKTRFGDRPMLGLSADITDKPQVEAMVQKVLDAFGRVDGLINNAAKNPKMTSESGNEFSRFENFPLEQWLGDLAVGLTGSFLCAQACGRAMAERGGGAIVNVSSDLGVIAPDQRIYLKPGQKEGEQAYKPVSYSVVKGGLVMLTRYLATYWGSRNIRVNTLTPASVYNDQDWHLVENISERVPLGRMSHPDEFKGALIFLLSDASSYMTGHNLILDGGRTIW
jgi:NAD(P)-dependent dehydrogenase (short-subunit alcohol dehydrogenase family)